MRGGGGWRREGAENSYVWSRPSWREKALLRGGEGKKGKEVEDDEGGDALCCRRKMNGLGRA